MIILGSNSDILNKMNFGIKHRKRWHKTNIIFVIIFVLSLLLGIKKMYWLSLLLATFNSIAIVVVYLKVRQKSIVLRYLLLIALAYFSSVSLKLFFFDWFKVPSDSMLGSILPGDLVLVDKLNYGPGFTTANLNLLSFGIIKEKPNEQKQKNYRLKGYSGVKRNDIVVFRIPADLDMVLIKRCVGIPGDTIQITNDKLFLNYKPGHESDNILITRRVYGDRNVLKSIEPQFSDRVLPNDKENNLLVRTSLEEWDKIVQRAGVDSCLTYVSDPSNLYPYHDNNNWDISNYGPIVIPRKGQEIKLDTGILDVYSHVIEKYEENHISIRNDSIFLNDNYTEKYRFKKNYYWMLGDNRNFSADSRYLGFVPEEKIIGKALLVLYAENNGTMNWERCFKLLN